MATYPLQVAPHSGRAIDKSVTPAQTGNLAPCGAGNGLLVTNGSGSAISVTIHVPGTVDGLAVSSRTVGPIPNGTEELIPLPDLYANPATGLATFDFSATPTSVTCAVVRVA